MTNLASVPRSGISETRKSGVSRFRLYTYGYHMHPAAATCATVSSCGKRSGIGFGAWRSTVGCWKTGPGCNTARKVEVSPLAEYGRCSASTLRPGDGEKRPRV